MQRATITWRNVQRPEAVEVVDGTGEIAEMFKDRVPDLTELANRNDGVFPLLKVIRGHGNPMPVFGNRYRAEAISGNAIFGAKAITRGRVLKLALYIQPIQK